MDIHPVHGAVRLPLSDRARADGGRRFDPRAGGGGLERELTRELRYAAARAGRTDLLPFYGGQSAPLASPRSAAELMAALVEETGAALELRWVGALP